MRLGYQFQTFNTPPQELGATLAETARAVEAAGFDAIWTMDHLLQLDTLGPVDSPMIEAYTTLGFLAAHTSRVTLGTLVTGPMYRHPGMLIKQITALDVLSGNALTDALGGVPEPLRQIAQAEAQLRQMMTTPGASFAEMERVAVLSGAAPLGEGSRNVPSGRWSLHPDGYYVRYLPSGYSSTRVEIWVPQGSPTVGKEYDPATHIAVPGNTARQRLIQSGRAHQQP